MGNFYRRIIAFVLTLLLICTSIVNAQVTTASMNGIVTDKSGQPLPGATVRAIHEPSGTQYGTSTREDGHYNLQGLRVGGPYSIHVSFVGYRNQDQSNLKLELDQNLRINFIMTEEAVQIGEVQIMGERSSVLSASRTGAASNVSRDNIDRLPTISRNFTDYLKLSPYFIGNSAQGRNYKYNNIQIDGANYNDLFGLGSSGTPGLSNVSPISLEAIQEFQIVISPFDVRQSGFTGAGVNAVTRSGNNNYSGAGFFYGRNQDMIGKSPDTLRSSYADFSEIKTGFRLGGPIIENNLFFFASAELTQYKRPTTRTFNAAASGTNLYTLSQDSINVFVNKLKSYGYDPGSFTNISFQRQSINLFARLDYNLSEAHRLTLRHTFTNGTDDNTPSYSGIYAENTRYKLVNQTNSTVLQLNSVLSNTMSNEFLVSYTTSRDKPTFYGQDFPFVQVKVKGPDGVTNYLLAGAENYRIKNTLDQDIIEITDNFTLFMGDHTLTFGTHNEIFSFANLYIRDYYGNYTFNTLADFVNNGPASGGYSLSFSTTGDPNQKAKFSAIQYGLYVQDEWNALPGLKITAGVRVDIPTLPDKPAYNYKFDSTFSALGYSLSTDKVPSGTPLFSPRIAFNYDVTGDRSTQVRGGIGMFTGRVPYVWISNQYGNTGVEFARLSYNTQTFVADPFNQPRGGTPIYTSEIDVTDKNFKMPQILRTSMALDQKLPYDFVGTIEGVYSKVINDIMYQDINMKGTLVPVNTTGLITDGKLPGDGRPVYGTWNSTTRRWTTQKWNGTDFTNVLLLKNTSEGSSANLTIQLQRFGMADGIDANFAYTYGLSEDLNSGGSSQAYSQWRYNHAYDPNNPVLATSAYDRTHRVMATVSYRCDWSQDLGIDIPGYVTTLGVYYSGVSGRPYSWVISGDLNGDGQVENDLAYIPKDRNDVILMNSAGTAVLPSTDPSYDQLDQFIANDSYLSKHRGEVASRLASREPWYGQIDLRLSQEIPVFLSHKVELTLDILNFMNMLNKDAGYIKTVSNQRAFLLNFSSLDPVTGKPRFTYGKLTDPAYASDLASRWQMQLGIRYSF
ncbi:MAG: carboxypeptidase regulatory-like domain-containing protein [Bacteroidota bacterium]